MDLTNFLLLGSGGLLSGIIAGFLGIGGGTILVPLIVTLGYLPKQAVATSSLAIFMTATAGSLQNWRMGYLDFKRVLALGLPSILTAQLGVFLANQFPPYLLLVGFGCLLLLNIYLIGLRRSLAVRRNMKKRQDIEDKSDRGDKRNQRNQEEIASPSPPPESPHTIPPTIAHIATGGAAGVIAGLFGLGGGVILVPLQMILLEENIKIAVQTSLGVIVITAVFACAGHAISGNVLFSQGICLGIGGLLGVQISTRLLPKLPDRTISFVFKIFMGLLAGYVFIQAWQKYPGAS